MLNPLSLRFALVCFAATAVPALAVDVVPIRCPAYCPDLTQFIVHHVNEAAGDQYNPHISGNLIAYSDQDSIKYYSMFSGATVPVPQAGGDVSWLPDISGSKIVFVRTEATGRVPVLVYDTSTSSTSEVDPQAAPIRSVPSIGGQTIAFVDQSLTAGGEILITDYSSSQPVTTRLTSDTRIDLSPSVSPDGNYIVWHSCATSVASCDVMLAARGSLGSWSVSQVGTNASGAWPNVDGQWIVYSAAGNSPGERDIYVRSLDGTTQKRLVIPGDQVNPAVSGGLVLFSSVPDGTGSNTGNEYELYMYQISTSRVWRITDTPIDESLNDISVMPDGSFNITWSSGASPERNVYAANVTLPSSVTPGDLLQQLTDLVATYNLKQGISNSLDAKLQNARAALDAARNNDIATACSLINAFMNEVRAQSGKSITTVQAQALLDLSMQVTQALGCA